MYGETPGERVLRQWDGRRERSARQHHRPAVGAAITTRPREELDHHARGGVGTPVRVRPVVRPHPVVILPAISRPAGHRAERRPRRPRRSARSRWMVVGYGIVVLAGVGAALMFGSWV